MKRLTKIWTSLVLAGALVSVLSGCGSKKEASSADSNKKTEVTFWAAPNPTQFKYWKEMAAEFEKKNPDIEVVVSQMKESPSSEAAIQSAIASNTAPTLSENISRSFASQLSDSKAIVNLNNLDDYKKIVKNRDMTETAQNWKFSGGEQYVIPMYTNPILTMWRTDILKEIGVNKIPQTYTEVLDAGRKLKAKYPDKALYINPDVVDPTSWKRWFDFFPSYEAASNGKAFIENNKLVANNKAVLETLNFWSELRKEKLIVTAKSADAFEKGNCILQIGNPSGFPTQKQKFPNFKYGEQWTVSNMMTPDSIKTNSPYTFADSKGIVVYSQASKNEQKAGMKFLKFVFSNKENDVKWMDTTSMVAARDSFDDEEFVTAFKNNPDMKPFLDATVRALPSMDNPKWNDIQQSFSEKVFVPAVNDKGNNEENWKLFKNSIGGLLE